MMTDEVEGASDEMTAVDTEEIDGDLLVIAMIVGHLRIALTETEVNLTSIEVVTDLTIEDVTIFDVIDLLLGTGETPREDIEEDLQRGVAVEVCIGAGAAVLALVPHLGMTTAVEDTTTGIEVVDTMNMAVVGVLPDTMIMEVAETVEVDRLKCTAEEMIADTAVSYLFHPLNQNVVVPCGT
jgi:hypothetical protein